MSLVLLVSTPFTSHLKNQFKKFTTQGVVRIFDMLENTEVLKKETNKKDLPHPIEYPPIAAVCWWCLGKAE